MAITRVGLTGAMAAYGTFTAKEEAAVITASAQVIMAVRGVADVIEVQGSPDVVLVRPAREAIDL